MIPLKFPQYFSRGIRGDIKWNIQKFNLKRSESIITDSNSSKKDIARFTGIKEDKINVVYLSASDDFGVIKDFETLNSVREKYNLPERFALYVGDVTWNKNLPRLIEAIKKINIPLVLVGKALVDNNFDRKNPWNQDLDKVQRMVEDNKLFLRLGFVPDKDLVALYNIATVFVMPSVYEGFGLPILEAMKCGCPVVTSKEGSLKEVGGDAVYHVDPYDVLDIANGIGEVYFNTKLATELSKKGLEQARKFSWEQTARETIDAYKAALNRV